MIPGMGGPMGGGFQGGGSSAASSNGPLDANTTSGIEAGTVTNGGITLNRGFRFDPENPVHVIGAGAALVFVGGLILRKVKK